MDKTYTAKRYDLGAIGNQIKDLDNQTKAIIKATALSGKNLGTFTLRGITITILKQPVLVGGMVRVDVSAIRNGQPLYVDNPLYFLNPPIMIWDGTYYQEYNQEFDITLDKMNFVEDLAGSLKELIVQTIESQN